MLGYSGDVVGSFTVTSSASPSTSSKFCRGIAVPNHRRPRPDPHRVERQVPRPGPHHRGPPRRTPRPRRRAGRPGCASDPCSPLIRRRRPRTRIAHHLPRPIRPVGGGGYRATGAARRPPLSVIVVALVIARSLPLLTDAQGRVRRPSQRARRRRQRNPRSSRRPSAPAPVAAGRAGTAQAGPSPPSMRQGAQRLAPDGVRATDVVSPRSSSPCGYASTQA